MKEYQLQNSIVKYIDLKYKDVLYTCTMGGVYLGKSSYGQKRLLKTNYKKGVPDLLIFEPNKDYKGLMIEIKTLKGRATKYQKEWISSLKERGYYSIIGYGFDEIKNIIDEYLRRRK